MNAHQTATDAAAQSMSDVMPVNIAMQAWRQGLPGEQNQQASGPGIGLPGEEDGQVPSVVVHNISKTYTLYSSPFARVKEAIHPFRKKYHKRFDALSNVSFHLEKGDFFGIMGKNGSGKTTLLQLLSGITQPSAGSVAVAGRISALLELGIGFNPAFSGRQNVYIYGAILGLSRQEIDECFSDIVAFSNLDDFIDQPVRTYSSGMHARLAFALAINVKPDILVVDEALAVGDALFQAKCFAKFRELQQKRTTVILVTHATSLITRFCNKACLLDQGKLLMIGPSKDVIDTYNRHILNHGRQQKITPTKPAHLSSSDNKNGGECRADEFYCNPNENRYGNGKAIIMHIGIYTRDRQPVQHLAANEEYEFRLDIKFIEPVTDPIISYRITTENGTDIAGTNTWYHNIETKKCKPDDLVRVSFSQKIPLNSGEYFLSASCAGFEHGKYVVYDRRYDALPFKVTAPVPCDGLIDPCATISVSREAGAALQTNL
jgi:teichoic acid transport system ATP-binding protein